MTPIFIFKLFQQLSISHYNIHYFRADADFSFANDKGDFYTALYLEDNFLVTNLEAPHNNIQDFTVGFWILDRFDPQDFQSRYKISDKTYQIGLEIIEKLRQLSKTLDYIYNGQFDALNSFNILSDNTIGWRFEINLRSSLNVSKCDQSFDIINTDFCYSL